MMQEMDVSFIPMKERMKPVQTWLEKQAQECGDENKARIWREEIKECVRKCAPRDYVDFHLIGMINYYHTKTIPHLRTTGPGWERYVGYVERRIEIYEQIVPFVMEHVKDNYRRSAQ